MRVAYVLTRAPQVDQESFVLAEGLEVVAQGGEVLFAPVRPSRNMAGSSPAAARARALGGGPAHPRTLARAGAEIVRHPATLRRVVRILASAGSRDRRWGPLARNLSTVTKAVALTADLRAWRPDHIHAHFSASTATCAWIAAEALGVPWSLTAHSATDIGKGNLLEGKVASARFARVISAAGERMLRERLPASLHERLVVVPMGVHRGVPSPRVPSGFDRESGVAQVLCTAHLKAVKGHRHLLDAMSLIPRAERPRLHLVGRGPEEGDVRARIEELGLTDRVVLHGALPNEDVLAVLASGLVDLVVLASLSEGVPVALMEAVARGVRVVATDVGGVQELVRPDNGTLVPPGDPVALATALRSELVGDGRPGRADPSAVRDRFCLSRNVRRLRALMSTDGPRASPDSEER